MEDQADTKKTTKNPEPIVVRGNQLITSALDILDMWNFCITWYTCSLMQLINNLEKIIVKSPGGELSSAFETSKDPGGEGALYD